VSEFDARIEAMRNKSNQKRALDRAERELKVAQHEALRQQKRLENRAKYPDVTAFVDALNKGGLNVRVLSVGSCEIKGER